MCWISILYLQSHNPLERAQMHLTTSSSQEYHKKNTWNSGKKKTYQNIKNKARCYKGKTKNIFWKVNTFQTSFICEKTHGGRNKQWRKETKPNKQRKGGVCVWELIVNTCKRLFLQYTRSFTLIIHPTFSLAMFLCINQMLCYPKGNLVLASLNILPGNGNIS